MSSSKVTIMGFAGKTPQIDSSAFLADGCRVIGDVLGQDSSLWFNVVCR